MSLSRSLKTHLVSFYLGRRFLRMKRWWFKMGRRGDRRVIFYHQPDDPHSHLLLQVLPDLAEHVAVEVRVLPVPDARFTPDRERLLEWGISDDRQLADRYGLSLPPGATPAGPDLLRRAQAAAVSCAHDLAALVPIGEALLAGDSQSIPVHPDASDVLVANQTAQHRAGHYLGGTLYYEGEWFWGLDRLGLLIERLRGEGMTLPGVLPKPQVLPADAVAEGTPLEFFFSFRSPYSYLAVERTLALAAARGVPLIIRPVLPMVMRGLSVPGVKVRFIARDAARLARQQGQPFGVISDPIGPGILQCLGLFVYADAQGRGAAFIQSAARGIWSEGLDITVEADLSIIVTRAGLDWLDARPWMDRPEGAALAEANRALLLSAGLWGVPSFRYGEFTAWGQDRLAVLSQVVEEGFQGGIVGHLTGDTEQGLDGLPVGLGDVGELKSAAPT